MIEAFSSGVEYPGFFAMRVAENQSFDGAIFGDNLGDESFWCFGIGEVAGIVG